MMDYLSIKEKTGWVSDLITRELQRFEKDTGVKVEEVVVSHIDKVLTSVTVNIDRRFQDAKFS